MKRKKEVRGKKDKKAQFFLIMAVVIGALLLGSSSLFNISETKTTQDNFNLKCENYYYEVQQLNKEYILHGGDFNQKLIDFTEFFLNENPELDLIYLYGDDEEVISNKDIELIDGKVNLMIEEWNNYERIFLFYDYNKFYFIMRQLKGEEIYFCEK